MKNISSRACVEQLRRSENEYLSLNDFIGFFADDWVEKQLCRGMTVDADRVYFVVRGTADEVRRFFFTRLRCGACAGRMTVIRLRTDVIGSALAVTLTDDDGTRIARLGLGCDRFVVRDGVADADETAYAEIEWTADGEELL